MSDLEVEKAEEQQDQVAIGFHPLGGIRLIADNVKLSPQEAFVLAGQLTAHAVMLIQMSYAEQAAQAAQLEDLMKRGGVKLPPGVK